MRSHITFKKSILALAVVQSTAMSAMVSAEDAVLLDELKVEGRAITELDQAVSSEDIEKNQASSLEDLFRNKSEVSAGGGTESGQKIYVRNLGEDSLNITIDGAEQATAVFHHAGRITIDPELLKRVEIEAGPADATSGPGALGGSIRFVTKDASDLLDDDKNVGALLKSTYSSNGGGLKNSVTIYGRTESEKVEGILHLADSNHDDYKDGGGNELDGSEQDEALGFAKLKVNITEEQTFTISHENTQEEGEVAYRPEWIVTDSNYVEDANSERQTTTLNYEFTDFDNDLIDTKATVYQTKNQQERIYIRSGVSSLITGYVETTGATIENTSLINSHELTYGVNHREDEGLLNSRDSNTIYNGSGTVTGVYAQDNIELTEKLTLSAGTRYDQYEVTDDSGDKYSAGGLSPNIGVVYQATETLKLNAHYAQAIRGPELVDAYVLYKSYDDDLDIETSNNIELGATYKKDQLEVGFGIYHSVIDDPIGTVDNRNVYANAEDAIETDGVYLDVTYQFNDLTAGLHFHSAETLAANQLVTRYEYGSTANSIGDTLVLSLDYEMSSIFQAGWSAEFVKGIDEYDVYVDIWDQTVSAEKPGYAVHNIYAKWLPLGDDQLTVSLTINNLFDKEYLSHASVADYTANSGYTGIVGQNAAGRDIRLSAAYKF